MTLDKLKQWRKNNPEKEKRFKRHHNLRKRYGLTFEEYEAKLLAQGNCCDLCGEEFLSTGSGAVTITGKKPYVDHCHETGQVRGILCHLCNTLLGAAKDNIETLEKAAQYLKRYQRKGDCLTFNELGRDSQTTLQ